MDMVSTLGHLAKCMNDEDKHFVLGKFFKVFYQQLSSVMRHCYRSGDLGFESQVGKIGHSVAEGSPPLRRFFGAVLSSR